ncbi:MAG: isopentenyl-diphosphate delta-isomerase, partial [Nitrosopumilaceae archaeon]
VLGILEKSSKFNLVKDEISDLKWITADELVKELEKIPEKYCPWMLIALYFLPSAEKSMLTKYESILSHWIKPKIKKTLEESIKYHLPDNNWRLVN